MARIDNETVRYLYNVRVQWKKRRTVVRRVRRRRVIAAPLAAAAGAAARVADEAPPQLPAFARDGTRQRREKRCSINPGPRRPKRQNLSRRNQSWP